MRRTVLVFPLAIALVAACSSKSQSGPDGGGATFDSGGVTFDGASGDDGSTSAEGGGGVDSGQAMEGGGGTDGGSQVQDSGGSPQDSASDAVAMGCTWSVSGGATGSGTCSVSVAFGASTSQLAVAITGGTGFFTFSAQIGSTASFAAGTWTYASVSVAGADFVQIPVAWDMSKGNTSGTTPQGDFTLNITQTGPDFMVDGGDLWAAPHGNLTITMPPSAGNTSMTNVTAVVTF